MVGGARSITLYDACTPSSGAWENEGARRHYICRTREYVCVATTTFIHMYVHWSLEGVSLVVVVMVKCWVSGFFVRGGGNRCSWGVMPLRIYSKNKC